MDEFIMQYQMNETVFMFCELMTDNGSNSQMGSCTVSCKELDKEFWEKIKSCNAKYLTKLKNHAILLQSSYRSYVEGGTSKASNWFRFSGQQNKNFVDLGGG